MKNLLAIILVIFGCIECAIIIFSPQISSSTTQDSIISLSGIKIGNQEQYSTSQKCFAEPKIEFFMYHYIRDDEPNDPPTTRTLSVTPANFESHMHTVQKLSQERKISVINGEQFENFFHKKCFPNEKIWVFTSDDGWIDNANYLALIAEKYNIPFTFAIIAGKLDKPGFMTTEQMQNIAKNPLFTIASHTMTHRMVNTLAESEETKEICQSKQVLEALLEKPINLFFYPSGRISKNSEKILKKCGYTFAWSTSFWKNFDWNHLSKFHINRTRISHNTGSNFFLEKANQ